MTPFRPAAVGPVASATIFVAGAVGFFVAAITLVAAVGGLALAGAALPGWASCSLWDCVGEALNNILSIPGALFGGAAVTVATAITVGGIRGATYGDGLGSGGPMGTEGEPPRGGDRWVVHDSEVYDDHGRPIPGMSVPKYTEVLRTRTIYAPNGNPIFHRVVVYGGNLPPGVPRTGWMRDDDLREHAPPSGNLGGAG